jgi:iron(III) transport system permease protein
VSTGLILSGTVLALVYAYSVRFLALPFGTLEAALGKITRSMDHAAQSLGKGPGETLARIHLPMLRGSMLTAGVLVFVDAMKELPMTLVLRPFNFETLATHVYQFASDELLEQAAPAAIGIVLTGLLPVLLLSRAITRTRADAVELPGGLP